MCDRNQPEWVSVTKFARKYGVDRGTVYKWLDNGVLKSYKQGGVRRILDIRPDLHFSNPPSVDGR